MMTIEELRDWFKPQLETGYPHLFYMVMARYTESPRSRLEVHKISESDIESLIHKLDGYRYTGIYSLMPRFV